MESFQTYPNLTTATTAVIVIMGLATVGLWLLKRFTSTQNLPKIRSRIVFAWILIGVFLLGVIYSLNYLFFFIAFIAFLALKEFLSITPTRRADRRILFLAYLTIPLQFCWIWLAWYEAFIYFIPVYIFLFLPFMMVLIGDTHGFLKAASVLGWVVVTTVFTLGHLAYLLVLPHAGNPVAGGAGLFMFLVILTQFNDVAQFLFGKLFVHTDIKLKVSTTRTWASLAGGIVLSALVAWLMAPLLTPFPQLHALAIGALIALGSFIGYTTMSAIKRDMQLKDRGSMVPGQGGVLNRIDSLLYTSPIFFHIVYYLYF